MTDTETTTRTLQYRLGVWTNSNYNSVPQTMQGVEYLGAFADLAARFDWAGLSSSREQWQETVNGYAERYAADETYPPLYNPIGGDWVWTPDNEPEQEPLPEGRTAQAEAIMVMRRREHEARERAEREGRRADAATAALNTLRSRVSELNSALNEQAEERDWCSEFEEFVERFPDLLSVEEHEYTVTLSVTVSRGTGDDHYSISEVLYNMDRSNLEYAISDVTEA